ncbi:MAG: IS1595 family transposase [Oscillospiraceae bacterium]|jgi:hypothetical protein|nr:IS1595 family transposase [Oscillospiraceae bacterium]
MPLTHNPEGEPIGFEQFAARYATEEACYEKLYSIRQAAGFCCPVCGCAVLYPIRKRGTYQCKACRHQTSLIAGTAMESTHLPLRKWFWAMYLVVTDKRGVSALYLQKHLHTTYKTAWFLLHRIRQMMGMREGQYMLTGVIEFADTEFGKVSEELVQSRGRNRAKVLVGMSTTKSGKPQYIKLVYVKDLKGKTIKTAAEGHFTLAAKLRTGMRPNYHKYIKEKYLTAYAVENADKEVLAWLRTIVSNIKLLFNGTYHGLDSRHIQRYLNEAAYRFNRRRHEDMLFERVLTAMPGSAHIGYKELTRTMPAV